MGFIFRKSSHLGPFRVSLTALAVSIHLCARLQGAPVTAADSDIEKLGLADYLVDQPVLGAAQKIALRKLYAAEIEAVDAPVGLNVSSNSALACLVSENIPKIIQRDIPRHCRPAGIEGS